MPSVDIVIVNYKVPHFVAQCLRSVEAAAARCGANVWVVDNDSQDGSVNYLKPLFPWVHFIENHHNAGFAAANNQAIRLGNAPYVLLLNPDTIIGESTLAHCLEFMERNATCGAIGIRMMDACGTFLKESKRGSVSLWSSFCKVSGLASRFPHSALFAGYYLGHRPDNAPCEAGILAGAFMLMRREAIEKVGLLDERYFMYGEDIDLSVSIRRAGYTCYYLPISMLHYKGESESAAANEARYLKAFYGAMQLYYNKYHPHRPVTRLLLGLMIKMKAKLPHPSRKKEKPSLQQVLDIDVAHAVDALPNGSVVRVSLQAGHFDAFLSLVRSCEGRGITFLTYNPIEKVTLGPGGVIPLAPPQ